jgi:hypothetical protein
MIYSITASKIYAFNKDIRLTLTYIFIIFLCANINLLIFCK